MLVPSVIETDVSCKSCGLQLDMAEQNAREGQYSLGEITLNVDVESMT